MASGHRRFIIGIVLFFLLYAFVHADVRSWMFKPGERPGINARLSLRTLARLQDNYYLKHNKYAETLAELGWNKPFDGYYNYFLNDAYLVRELGINLVHTSAGERPAFFALAVGNVDDDDDLDIWLIDENGRLVNIVNDI